MNKIGIFILLCALCALSACKKDDNNSKCKDLAHTWGGVFPNNGTNNVWLNGHIWRSSHTYASIEPNTDSLIQLQIFNIQGGDRHTELDIRGIDLNTQRQTIVMAYLFPFAGPDVLWPVEYVLLVANPDSNYIEITQHNDNFSEFRGRYQLTFYQKPQQKNPDFPDTLKFYNGNFHIPDINQKDWICN